MEKAASWTPLFFRLLLVPLLLVVLVFFLLVLELLHLLFGEVVEVLVLQQQGGE